MEIELLKLFSLYKELIDKDEAYENYNIGNIVNPIIFK